MKISALGKRFRENIQTYIIIILLIVIWGVFAIVTDGNYVGSQNISNLFRQMAVTSFCSPASWPILLAAAGLVSAVARAWPRLGAPLEPGPRRAAALSLALLAFLAALALAVILARAGELVSARVPLLRLRTAARPALLLLASLGGLLLVSRRARALARAAAGSSPGFFVAAAALAFWLSLGPSPRALGRALPLPGLYAALYEHVPGKWQPSIKIDTRSRPLLGLGPL